LLEGKKVVDVFSETMNASNIFNFPHSIHQSYIRKSIEYCEKHLID